MLNAKFDEAIGANEYASLVKECITIGVEEKNTVMLLECDDIT